MSLVTILSLGGTILSRYGSTEAVPLSALLAPDSGRVELIEIARLGSNLLSFSDIASLAERIIARHREETQAFVLVQGTDTLEETSFLLDLLLPADVTLVVTGAMRTNDLPGADGPANLQDAISAARALLGAATGVTVCFGGELHAARLVRKIDANRPAAFQSPGFGPIGSVIEGRCRLVTRPLPAPGPYVVSGEPPVVGLLTLYFDISAAEVAAFLTCRLDGLVVAGLGAGTMPAAIDPLLAAAARTMPLVIASRCGQGEVSAAAYVGAGTTHSLSGQGAIPGFFLEPRKMRILLTVLLWSGCSVPSLAEALAAWHRLGHARD